MAANVHPNRPKNQGGFGNCADVIGSLKHGRFCNLRALPAMAVWGRSEKQKGDKDKPLSYLGYLYPEWTMRLFGATTEKCLIFLQNSKLGSEGKGEFRYGKFR